MACNADEMLDFPQERFLEFCSVADARVANLITHGNDSSERLGGIQALDALIEFDEIDVAQKTTKFVQALRSVFRGKDLRAMEPAAVALGKICRPGSSLISELVEAEVKTALKWLQSDRVEERWFTAFLVLRELGKMLLHLCIRLSASSLIRYG